MRTSWQLGRNWRTLHAAVLAVPMLATLAGPLWAADLYWDLNGAAAGAGGPAPSGTWNSTLTNFNTDATGGSGGALSAWTSSTDNAFFSANSDATGAYTVTSPAALTANSVTVKDGTVTFAATGAITATNGFTITNGATAKIASASMVAGGAGAKVTLDGGRLMQTNPGNAGSFVPAALGLQIGASGSGTVDYSSSGSGAVSIYAGTITGVGGTTTNGGFGTLVKTGPGEFRYQNTGLPNTTYSKLVVKEGLFRLGYAGSTATELGFGAAPLAPTADAITLDGGAIGTSFAVTTNANRGIYVTPNGGTINTSGGSFTSSGAVTGDGILTVTGSGGVVINPISHVGGLNILGSLTANRLHTHSLTGTGTLKSGTIVGIENAADSSFAGVVSGAELYKQGTATLTLGGTSANNFSTLISYDGTVALNKPAGTTAGAKTNSMQGGTLLWMADEQMRDDAYINISRSVLDLNGHTETMGQVVLFGGTITGGTLKANTSIEAWSGNATGLGGPALLTKTKTGDLTLGTNTYTGGTDIQQGRIFANNGSAGNATGPGIVIVESGATLTTSTGGSVATVRVLPGGTITTEPLQILVVNGDALIEGTSSGNINYMRNVVVTGTLSPGNSPGTQTVAGDLTLQGTTLMEIAGTAPGQYDQVVVGGAIAYGGELDVQLLGTYLPHAGDFFNFFDFSTQTGTFNKVVLPPLPSGLVWDTTALYTGGILSVAVPLPTSAWMSLPLLASLATLSRRRHTAPT